MPWISQQNCPTSRFLTCIPCLIFCVLNEPNCDLKLLFRGAGIKKFLASPWLLLFLYSNLKCKNLWIKLLICQLMLLPGACCRLPDSDAPAFQLKIFAVILFLRNWDTERKLKCHFQETCSVNLHKIMYLSKSICKSNQHAKSFL